MQQTEKITERTIQQDSSAKALSSQQYLHTPLAAAMVPLLQALITGLVIGVALFAVLASFRVMDAWKYGLVTWLLVQAAVWLLLSTHWLSLTNLEKLTGLDINRDGVIGAPGQKAQPKQMGVKITLRTITDQGHFSGMRELELPGDPAAIVMLATALLGGASFAERVWSGEGKLFSQKDFREIRRIMESEENKMIILRNSKDARQGYMLTSIGIQAMEGVRDRYAEMANPSPTE